MTSETTDMIPQHTATAPYADLGMYPFRSVLWAWDELWSAIHARALWLPAELARSSDAEQCWSDPNCVATHMCGWPIATRHRDDVHVVGTFQLDIPGAEAGGRYRSVLLSPHDRPLDELVTSSTTAVVNSHDSLSGWLSLRAATVGPGGTWPGTVTRTGAHVDSIRALAEGRGDLTSVDAWSVALIRAEEPDLFRDLHEVGAGPVVPVPALVVRRGSVDPERLAQVSTAFTHALVDPDLADARHALRIAGPAAVDADEYASIAPLVTA